MQYKYVLVIKNENEREAEQALSDHLDSGVTYKVHSTHVSHGGTILKVETSDDIRDLLVQWEHLRHDRRMPWPFSPERAIADTPQEGLVWWQPVEVWTEKAEGDCHA
jgi:hypothetical protein